MRHRTPWFLLASALCAGLAATARSEAPHLQILNFQRYEDQATARVILHATEHAWVVLEVHKTTTPQAMVATGSGFVSKNTPTPIELTLHFGQLQDDSLYLVIAKPRYLDLATTPIQQQVNSLKKEVRYRLAAYPRDLEEIRDVQRDWQLYVTPNLDGTLELVFDTPLGSGRRDRYQGEKTSPPGHTRKFAVNFAGVAEGYYRFHFEGTHGDTALADREKSYVILKSTKPVLQGLVTLSVEQGDKLNVQFQLSHKIKAALRFDDGTKLPDIEGKGDIPPYTYTAELSLQASDHLNRLKGAVWRANAQNPTQPLEVAVISRTPDHLDEEIGKIRLSVVKLEATKIFTELAQVQDKDKIQDEEAQAIAKKALGLETKAVLEPEEQQAVEYLVSVLKEQKGKRHKLAAFAKLAAKVGMGYFGIPVP